MNWFTFHRAYQICIKTNKKSCLLQWTLIITPQAGTTTVFSVDYPSYIILGFLLSTLISSRSGCWTAALDLKITSFLTRTSFGGRRFSHIEAIIVFHALFLIQWIGPSYFLWKSGFCSVQKLFLSKLWTLRLNFRCHYFLPLFTESFSVTAMPTNRVLFQSCYSVSKGNHTSAQRVAPFMYFKATCWLGTTGTAQSSLNEGQPLP